MATPYVLGCDLSVPTYAWKTSAGADNVNTSFPLTNLKTYFAADVSKSNSTGASQYFLIDLGAATACNTLAISGHNFNLVADASIVLQVNSNDDTDFTDEADVKTLWEVGTVLTGSDVFTFSSATKRYWRIIFQVNVSVAPQIGNIFLGTRTTFTSTYEWDFAKENKAYETMESTSINGDIRTSQVFSGRKRWDLLFRLQSDTFKTAWNTFISTVRGRLRPFFFVDADSTVNYVHLENDYNEVKNFRYNQNNLRIQMKEQVAS